jgi:16S rRNA (adenine1518-N6/adenine1519-N6)-dimethyltransferase
VANLPYAVAATVVLDCFERFASVESATVMVQAEVADRMAAKPGTKNYGAYTVKLRMFAEPAGRFSVSPGNFFPPPRVESSVIRLDRVDCGLTVQERTAACRMADAAFATRRKTIANSCKTYFSGQGAAGKRILGMLPEIFATAGIDPKRRGESLSLEEFKALGKAALPYL